MKSSVKTKMVSVKHDLGFYKRNVTVRYGDFGRIEGVASEQKIIGLKIEINGNNIMKD